MDQRWFYLGGEAQRGPVDLPQLLTALFAMPDPRRVLVWREGLSDWKAAGDLPELSARLPPPTRRPAAASRLEQAGPIDQAEAVARYYRRLVLLVGAQIVLAVISSFQNVYPSDIWLLLSPLAGLALIVIGIAGAITTYRLMKSLGSGGALLWALAMFVPCLNILFMLMVSARAQAWCRTHGIEVGLLGPKRSSLERVRASGPLAGQTVAEGQGTGDVAITRQRSFGTLWGHWRLLVFGGLLVGLGFAAVLYLVRESELEPFNARVGEYVTAPRDNAVTTGSSSVKGRIITVDKRAGRIDHLYFDLPKRLRAATPDDVGTIVWLEWGEDVVGKYTDGAPASVVTCKVTVIDRALSAIVGQQEFRGSAPPETKKGAGGRSGSRPIREIVAYLEGAGRR